jgi:hypothetical protein
MCEPSGAARNLIARAKRPTSITASTTICFASATPISLHGVRIVMLGGISWQLTTTNFNLSSAFRSRNGRALHRPPALARPFARLALPTIAKHDRDQGGLASRARSCEPAGANQTLRRVALGPRSWRGLRSDYFHPGTNETFCEKFLSKFQREWNFGRNGMERARDRTLGSGAD